MGIVYVSAEGEDQILLTPEVHKCPNAVPELQVYIERYLRAIRDDLMRMLDGSWRLIVVDDNLEFQQYNVVTETWIRKFRIREDTT